MEKKNFKFTAYDSRRNEIKMKHAMVFYGITEEMAKGIRMGIAMGLLEKYSEPSVTYKQLNAAETAEYEQEFAKKFNSKM